jgi:DnaJ homolog subfamily A member 2
MSKLYKILSVDKSSSSSQIKKAYHKLALKWHPDKNQSKEAETKFKEIGEAYAILSNKEERSMYDRMGDAYLEQRNNGGGGGVDPMDIFQQMFGGGMGGMGMPFGFGGGRRRQQQENTNGSDIKLRVPITLKEVFTLKEKEIEIPRQVRCRTCKGLGTEKESNIDTCSQCNGQGRIVRQIRMGPGMISQQIMPCHACKGKGKSIPDNLKCSKCNSNKFDIQQVKVTIPVTMEEKLIVMGNQGNESQKSYGQNGKLVIQLEIDYGEFSRDDDNLLLIKEIALSDALLGTKFVIEHPNGEALLVQHDEVIQPNDIKIINGYGCVGQYDVKGDLVIQFKVVFPVEIHRERKELLNKILPRKEFNLDKYSNLQKVYLDDYQERQEQQRHSAPQCAHQ